MLTISKSGRWLLIALCFTLFILFFTSNLNNTNFDTKRKLGKPVNIVNYRELLSKLNVNEPGKVE